jgi:hypothetical protein
MFPWYIKNTTIYINKSYNFNIKINYDLKGIVTLAMVCVIVTTTKYTLNIPLFHSIFQIIFWSEVLFKCTKNDFHM